VGEADTEDLRSKVAKLVDAEGRKTYLLYHIGPSVHSCGTYNLGPHNKDQGNVVDPSVNAVQEIVAELCAVRQAEQE
jgi:hypothetical protein